jgi:hypothetical protein
VAEIPAKKLKRGRRKKSWLEEFMEEFWPNFAEKGQKKFLKRISFLAELFSSTGQKYFRDLATLAAAYCTHSNS